MHIEYLSRLLLLLEGPYFPFAPGPYIFRTGPAPVHRFLPVFMPGSKSS